MSSHMEVRLQRGNLLWEGSRFLLPEHKQAIIPLFQEEEKLKPELDEHTLAEIEQVLQQALAHRMTISLSYWKQHDYETLIDVPVRYNQASKQIMLQDSFEELFSVFIEDVVDARIQGE